MVNKYEDEQFCPSCGAIIKKEAEICPSCGVGRKKKSRGLAVLLALLFGGIGIHHFYLENPGRGFLYMIFFWTFIPAILAFIDAIVLIFMSNEDFHQKYG